MEIENIRINFQNLRINFFPVQGYQSLAYGNRKYKNVQNLLINFIPVLNNYFSEEIKKQYFLNLASLQNDYPGLSLKGIQLRYF